MAPKKPTMLQRQRALRKQQQQTKQQSSKQLPPKGQTSANSRQARGQRTSTAKAQAANQQRVIARGMEGFVRRGQAMDKLDKAAKGTQGSGTRTAGAGGGLAKRQSSAVTNRQSGKPATTGGRVQPNTGGGASSNRVQPVRVRDLGTTKPNQMSGNTPRALPPGRSGGALARTARGAANVAKGARGAGRFLGPVGTAIAAADQVRNVFNPKDNIITRGAALGRSIERVVGSGGGSNMTPGQRNAQLAAKRGQRQGPQQTPQMVADYKAKRDRRHQSLRDNMPPVQARTSAPRQQPPAASAPAARPSASRPSQTRPSRTTSTATGSQQARPAEKKPSMGRETFDRSGKGSLGPNYGIDQFGDKNGIDMERRRAFLDAKDSQEGRKAINKLMEERRKKQRENDSTSK